MHNYYPFFFKFGNMTCYCIWFSDEIDSFLVKDDKILCFPSIITLKHYADLNKICYMEEITGIDIERAISWLNTAEEYVDCKYMLEFWNAASDVSNSLGEYFMGNLDFGIVNDIYLKLFYGNNLPAVKGDEEDFIPEWNKNELETLIKVVNDGLRVIGKNLDLDLNPRRAR